LREAFKNNKNKIHNGTGKEQKTRFAKVPALCLMLTVTGNKKMSGLILNIFKYK
jgi:hypothetical protein